MLPKRESGDCCTKWYGYIRSLAYPWINSILHKNGAPIFFFLLEAIYELEQFHLFVAIQSSSQRRPQPPAMSSATKNWWHSTGDTNHCSLNSASAVRLHILIWFKHIHKHTTESWNLPNQWVWGVRTTTVAAPRGKKIGRGTLANHIVKSAYSFWARFQLFRHGTLLLILYICIIGGDNIYFQTDTCATHLHTTTAR